MLLHPASLSKTVAALRSSQRDLLTYIEEVLARIDATEPHVGALMPEENRRARLLREAAELQAKYPEPATRPPLYGVLVGVKDLYFVDGFRTTAGSSLPPELFTGPEGSVVKRLREAGALILGKTTTDEFAYSDPSPTKNPHNLAHTPGGSSSGSAAGVATGITPLGIGTQTSRSIIAPASFCGVVGFKPSYGRIRVDGVVMLSESLDTVGFLTHDVESMRLASAILIEGWQEVTVERVPVLGVPTGKLMGYMWQEARDAFEEQVQALVAQGYQVKHVDLPCEDEIDFWYDEVFRLLRGEMARQHQEWYVQHEALYRKQSVDGIVKGQAVTAEVLERARGGQIPLREAFAKRMEEAGIDLWICPSQPCTALELGGVTGHGGQTSLWSYAGMPCVSVPAGVDAKRLPRGFQCIGGYGQDESLLAWTQPIADVLRERFGVVVSQ